jgi:AAA family ATP:ADP antiporter
MDLGISKFMRRLIYVEPHERLKLFFLTLIYFLIITTYTVAKEFKDSVFVSVVGKGYVPTAKIATMLALIPAIFLYSKLVDKLRRYQLLCFYSLAFGILGLVFTLLLGHSTIGLPNTNASATRLFGWLFYFFVEGYSPFLVSVFWAFANSVNSPESAKKNYGLMVSGSKIGGMLSAGLGWYIFSSHILQSSGAVRALSDTAVHQLVFGVTSALLLLVVPVVFLLMKKVPGRYLHGYEAAYQVEKQKGKEGKAETGIFAGITMLFRYPYVLGIFGMVFFYEVIQTVFSYLRLDVAQADAHSMGDFTGNLFKLIFISHTIGFLISLLGTATLLRYLGERICLILIPVVSGSLVLYVVISGLSPIAISLAFVSLKSIYYAFSWPVRESLYIPTVKEIKFKSKSWIDAFGSKFAKTTGSTFNIVATGAGSFFLQLHMLFFGVLIGFWTLTAWLLGKRFEQAVARNEVIGADEFLAEEKMAPSHEKAI